MHIETNTALASLARGAVICLPGQFGFMRQLLELPCTFSPRLESAADRLALFDQRGGEPFRRARLIGKTLVVEYGDHTDLQGIELVPHAWR